MDNGRVSVKKISILSVFFLITQLTFVSNAEEYSSAVAARDAAKKAMIDFQTASAECRDVTNSKNNLTSSESAGIKIILEHAKTLLEDCAVPEIFSEESVKKLMSDNSNTPARGIEEYSDFVMEFEAYSNSIEAVIDDINNSLPNLKEIGRLIVERNVEITSMSTKLQKFESAYSGYSNDIKTQINSMSAWSTYQNIKATLPNEKANYEKALAILDDLNRLVDLDTAAENISALFSNKIQASELEKLISEITAMAVPRASISVNEKKITIKCSKGKVIKKVSGVNPKCPPGYKKGS